MKVTTFATETQASNLAEFQHELKTVAERASDINLREHELLSADLLEAGLAREVGHILRDMQAVLDDILEHCELEATRSRAQLRQQETATHSGEFRSSYLPFERAVDENVSTRLGSKSAVEELAFIAQLELQQRLGRLERARRSGGAMALLEASDGSLRRVVKAAAALDTAIARVEQTEPVLTFETELQQSLSIRRGYSKFRRRVLEGGVPTADVLKLRLRQVGTLIAMVIGWEIYPHMRIADRLLLRDLQRRVLDYLREDHTEQATGLRLWEDVVACINLLSRVNQRQELVAHDQRIIENALNVLGSDDSDIPSETWRYIRSLEGLDEDLDRLLCRSSPPEAGHCAAVLSRLVPGAPRSRK